MGMPIGIGDAKPHESAPEKNSGQQSVEGKMVPFEGTCVSVPGETEGLMGRTWRAAINLDYSNAFAL